MDTEDNDYTNGYYAWKVIIAEGDHLLPQESGKEITFSKVGGQERR